MPVNTEENNTQELVPTYIVKAISIPSQIQEFRAQFRRPDSIRLFHKKESNETNDESSSDEECINLKNGITISKIVEKKVEDNGRVYYIVVWSDNTTSKEAPSVISKIDHDAVEQFEHKIARKILNL
ncbi:hypothetical protein PHYBLDRAFT_187333 [Phycomyces blakesleeanus NRRL 1555(-)]|uniref:Chromo domain-containing protein n=1 Tax=Phycomyces blakesleeanus (strain ATCC 8743b / DSM 1359 / FGSC 10004 / NBRC 33097 / NRRL 1555) TaxID=763407 RepID=A0A167MAJ2_PHYB8|nr:hypothetical protein PHYBLDRAFT_187333 [Phycomyces blakesleeanus NRRL 1555(-)]OAD72287.1 hypothetical protein PHYBLDRAFT_187333 [Phycomyces blakesleeanus NRRL 1555(-)]|eukprot:XP_018290327.1 hypothetical protein PHYBLDRAFT_187333 [Phycomyces blakesleeanus NRRL 1555(-)]